MCGTLCQLLLISAFCIVYVDFVKFLGCNYSIPHVNLYMCFKCLTVSVRRYRHLAVLFRFFTALSICMGLHVLFLNK